METPNTIRSILAKGETAHMEFKSSAADLETLGETICAFLNSGGGQIVVGVLDNGQVDGEVSTRKIEALLRKLSGGAAPGGLISPNAVWDVSEERVDGGTVAIIDVPSGGDLPYVFRDSIFIRVGSQTRQAGGRQTRALIEKRYLLGARWERQPAIEVTLSDLDEKEIIKTAKVAADKRGWQFRDPDDLTAILEDLNLIDHGRLTNAAVVLFANEAGHIFPQAQVRMTVYNTDKTGAALVDDRVAHGHLFANLNEYDAFLRRHVSIVSDFSASKSAREDSPVFPYWALREGFRNALMHRDYSSYHGRASVSVFPRHIEIWSFGELPRGLSIASLKNADRSLPVNPDIAQVLFLRGLVELLGRGTRKIVEEFRSLGLPEPGWKEQAGGITLTMRGGHPPGELPGELNARQIDLLRRTRPGKSLNLNTVLKSAGGDVSERTVRNDLARLVKLGFLFRQGQGKSTFYVRTEKPFA
jgi:ATP-dependent DNA helicase RecG